MQGLSEQKVLLIQGQRRFVNKAKEIILLLKKDIFTKADINLITNQPRLFSEDKNIRIVCSKRGILGRLSMLNQLQDEHFECVAIPFIEEQDFKYKFFAFLCSGKYLLIFNKDLTWSYWNKWYFLYYLFKKDIKNLLYITFRIFFLLLSFIYIFICVAILFIKRTYHSYFINRLCEGK